MFLQGDCLLLVMKNGLNVILFLSALQYNIKFCHWLQLHGPTLFSANLTSPGEPLLIQSALPKSNPVGLKKNL